MDIDNNNQNEEIKLLNVFMYAVDQYGIEEERVLQ